MQRPAPGLLWKLGSWCERCPAKGGEVEARRTWRRMRMRERRRRERRVEADTLGNLYNYPQGQPEAAGGGTGAGGRAERGQRVAECREGGGTHIDPGNHPALPGLLRHLSELLPPVHHLALAPPTSSLPPLFLLSPSTAPPSLSRATFCVPAMLRCRVFMSSSQGVKTAGLRQVRCTPKKGLLDSISVLKYKLDRRDACRLLLSVLTLPTEKPFDIIPSTW